VFAKAAEMAEPIRNKRRVDFMAVDGGSFL
jgi:hypothetical protein